MLVKRGNKGDDVLVGGVQADLLLGLGGNDVLVGGAGNDRLRGGNGRDRLSGGAGADELSGDGGDDLLRGGSGHDVLGGGAGNDRLFGDIGTDVLNGGTGDDYLEGGAGVDTSNGQAGDDVIVVQANDRAANGGAGFDTLKFNSAKLTLTLVRGPLLEGFEQVDLGANGAHTLTLDDDAINRLFGTSLGRITGGSGNRVVLNGFGWKSTGETVFDNGFNYGKLSNGVATLELQFGLSFSATPHRNIQDMSSARFVALPPSGGGILAGGQVVDFVGDMNQDGIDDFIVNARFDRGAAAAYVVFGTPAGVPPLTDLAALDGVNGFRVTRPDDIRSQGLSGADLNGDGIGDLIINLGTDFQVIYGRAAPYAAVIDISAVPLTEGVRIGSGLTARAVGDINGDGVEDLAVVEGEAAVGIVYGRHGNFAADITLNELDGTNGFRFVQSGAASHALKVSGAGDINGDGFDDLVFGAPRGSYIGPGESRPADLFGGAAFVLFGQASSPAQVNSLDLNGSNGFWVWAQPSFASVELGNSVASAGDFNGDGIDDFMLVEGSQLNLSVHLIYGTRGGFAADVLLDSLDGSNGFTLEGFADSFGSQAHAAGDFNGDGYDDIAFTAPAAEFGIGTHGMGSGGRFVTEQGLVYVLFGHGADGVARVSLADLDPVQGLVLLGGNFAGHLGGALGSGGDINGDGFDDLVLSSNDGNDGGAYIVHGHAANNAQIRAGTTAGETLLGDANENAIVAGAGNDLLNGGAGRDVLKGGAGDDTLIFDAADFRIEGDDGNDTLVLAGQGTALDLTLIDNLRIDGIEVIDLSGSGANSAHVSLREVLALSDTRTLRINGDADDAVSTADGWSLAGGGPVLVGDTNYTLYTQAGASLLVEVGIQQSGIVVV
jgi:hypothetical protein